MPHAVTRPKILRFFSNSYQYTFETRNGQQLLGTLTLIIDSDDGLLADQLYKPEIDFSVKRVRKYVKYRNSLSIPTPARKKFLLPYFTSHTYMHILFMVLNMDLSRSIPAMPHFISACWDSRKSVNGVFASA